MHALATMNQATALVSTDHREIAERVSEWLPIAMDQARVFGKRQTQFMDHVLTVNHPTPLRNLRQILAEVTDRKEALQHNIFALRKADVEHRRAIAKLAAMDESTVAIDPFGREILVIEIEEKAAGLASARLYVEGAIRQVAGWMAQYESICAARGSDQFTEMDVEREEASYHIQTAFNQALIAARARGGTIDEGNHIYLSQLGINGRLAQNELDAFFADELAAIARGEIPLVDTWLAGLAVKYARFPTMVCERRGMIGGPIAEATVGPQ